MFHTQEITETKSSIGVAKSNVPFFTPVIQKKLSVGASNDYHEVEADRVADSVMRMSSPSKNSVTHTGALVQRKCAACEQEEKIQKKSLADTIQRVSQSTSEASTAPSHVESSINSSRGGGSTMDQGTKNFMESRFGTDFSEVKIHTGSQAVQMSRDLNAQAFTVGNDIYFNEGKYNPNSDSGKHLLAHELTHTIQQSGNVNRKIQRECLTTEPTATDTRYITGSGDSRREYVFPDSAGAQGFIRTHSGLNLVCYRIQRGSRTVYIIYQRATTTSRTTAPSVTTPRVTSPVASDETTRSRICLTFDDGPQNGTEQVLDQLAAVNAKGTFFLTGINMSSPSQVADQTRLVTRMISEHHRIGNHTFTHSIATRGEYAAAYPTLIDSNTTNDSASQIRAFEREYSRNSTYFSSLLGTAFPGFDIARLPGDGRLRSQLVTRTSRLGMSHVGWNFEFAPNGVFSHVNNNDWQGITGVAGTSSSLPRANSVILFHDRHWAGGNQTKLANLLAFLNRRFSFGIINSSGNCSNP